MVLTSTSDGIQTVERSATQIVYAALCAITGGGCIILAAVGLLPGDTFFSGGFFLICGVLLGKISEIKTTTFSADGKCSVNYRRNFGSKEWTRYFQRNEITGIDLAAGRSKGNYKHETIYVALTSGEQVDIGSRLNERIATGRYAWPVFGAKFPLSNEASQIADFLQVPLRTIDMMSVKNSVKNFFTPQDKMMKAGLQRPSQEELDKDKI